MEYQSKSEPVTPCMDVYKEKSNLMEGLFIYWQNQRIIYCVYQGGTIDHCTHVTGPVSYRSAESEYNKVYTSVMALEHFRIINN